jgi:mannitol-specific phosphotransferase system IIBC component
MSIKLRFANLDEINSRRRMLSRQMLVATATDTDGDAVVSFTRDVAVASEASMLSKAGYGQVASALPTSVVIIPSPDTRSSEWVTITAIVCALAVTLTITACMGWFAVARMRHRKENQQSNPIRVELEVGRSAQKFIVPHDRFASKSVHV